MSSAELVSEILFRVELLRQRLGVPKISSRSFLKVSWIHESLLCPLPDSPLEFYSSKRAALLLQCFVWGKLPYQKILTGLNLNGHKQWITSVVTNWEREGLAVKTEETKDMKATKAVWVFNRDNFGRRMNFYPSLKYASSEQLLKAVKKRARDYADRHGP
jgi:hypothetical protein